MLGIGKAKKVAVDNIKFFNEILKDVMLKKVDDRYLSFNNSFNVTSYDKDERCVYLADNENAPLWGIELMLYGNNPIWLENFKNIAKNHGYSDNAKLTLFYTKNKLTDEDATDGFYTKQSIYLFSQNKQLLEDIAYEFGLELMRVEKLFQAFYDIGFISKYHLEKDDDVVVKSEFHYTDTPIDDLNIYFKQIYAEGVYGAMMSSNDCDEHFDLYQGLMPKSKLGAGKPDLIKLFGLEWYGYIAFNYDFSYKHISDKVSTDLRDVSNSEIDKKIRQRYKSVEEYKDELIENSCIANVVMAIDNPRVVKTISTHLNIDFIVKKTMKKDIIYATPLVKKDANYNFLVDINEYGKYVRSVHKQINTETRLQKNMFGRDVCGNVTIYSLSEGGEGIHGVIVAPTRSGKTFNILKMIQNSCGIKVKAKTESELLLDKEKAQKEGKIFTSVKVAQATKLGKDTKVVHFDKGYSAIKFISELKKFTPEQVHIVSDDVNIMRFSLLNIKKEFDAESDGYKLNEEDILFSESIINLILTVNEESPLTLRESAEFSSALYRVFFDKDFRGMTLSQLRDIKGYDEVLEKIAKICEAKGIKLDNKAMTRLRLTDEELDLANNGLEYMTKPILNDVLKEIKNKQENFGVDTETTEILNSLHNKLKAIANMTMFAYYDQNELVDTDYYYFELNRIKDLGVKYFLPAFLITFNRLYRRDMANAQKGKMANEEIPQTIYIIEEADNFLKVEVLEKLFEMILREASRFSISLIFITQNPKDISTQLLNNIHNRLVLSSNEITFDDLIYFWSKNKDDLNSAENKNLVDFYMRYKEQYLTFISSGKGIVTLKNFVTQEEATLFNSNALAKGLKDVTKIA